jgi:hypothetical protein
MHRSRLRIMAALLSIGIAAMITGASSVQMPEYCSVCTETCGDDLQMQCAGNANCPWPAAGAGCAINENCPLNQVNLVCSQRDDPL